MAREAGSRPSAGDIGGVSSHGLSLSDSILAGMVSISADAVIAVDDRLRIIFFNSGAERIFGYSAAEAMELELAALLPERFRAAHSGHVTLFGTSHEHARRLGERQEISGLRRNGEEFAAEASIATLQSGGRIVYTAVLRDVSERKRIERDLRAALRARDDMAGIVSHDLRNPVQAIRMLSGAILGSTDNGLDPAIAEQVTVIRHAAEQMDALIQDLLDVTRIDSGQLHVTTQPLDLGRLLDESLDVLEPLAMARGQTLALDVSPGLPDVLADAARVEQLLSNVVGNAIKYTPRGGRIELSARHAPNDGCVVVAVRDTGSGIPAEQLPHVFDRYWQSARTGRHGAGLGLTIAKGIVEAHGGRIELESEPGRGPTVTFTLPGVGSRE